MSELPRKCAADDASLPDILALVQKNFAYMEDRIDPPSSMHSLTLENIAEQAASGEIWVLEQPPRACVFLSKKPHALYLGKLAVDAELRGRGFATRLVAWAETRAHALGFTQIELETRIELVENHAAFAALGFEKIEARAHYGYARPTYIVMRKQI